MAEIRKVVFGGLPKSSGSVRLSDLRLVQVDYVMMPGKEQARSMSAREVAEGKMRKLREVPTGTNVSFTVHFYENGKIKQLLKWE